MILVKQRRRAGAQARLHVLCAAVSAVSISTSATFAVTFGQLDDFQNGTVMGWREGAPSPNPPTNIANGGPNGAGDRFMQVSSGGDGAGSRMLFFNPVQWSGNYNTAGVTRINAMMRNLGATDLHMRVTVVSLLNTAYSSTTAAFIPAASQWQPVTFDLGVASMTNVQGTQSLATVLDSVASIRMLSAQNGPSFRGDAIVATVGVDNIRALRLPGDANFDGNVNLADFNALAANFGTSGSATWQQGDFNFDQTVNLADFNLLASNFGMSAGADGPTADDWATLASVVPEPASCFSMIALLTGALAPRRKR